MKDYVKINGHIYGYIERKCSEIKQSSPPTRSLNGTLNIDVLTTSTKREWSFTFTTDERGLERLRSLWRLNSTYTIIDWDESSYTATCTSDRFDENFVGEDNGICWFDISLDFKEI